MSASIEERIAVMPEHRQGKLKECLEIIAPTPHTVEDIVEVLGSGNRMSVNPCRVVLLSILEPDEAPTLCALLDRERDLFVRESIYWILESAIHRHGPPIASSVGSQIVAALCDDITTVEEDPEANEVIVSAGVRAAIACAIYAPQSVVAPTEARSLGKRSKEAVNYSLNNWLEQTELGIGNRLHAFAAFGVLKRCQQLAWLFH